MVVARKSVLVALVGFFVTVLGPVTSSGAVVFKRLFTVQSSSSHPVAMARTADGRLHLAYQTYSSSGVTGIGAQTISASGAPGPVIQALSGWTAGQPGLLAQPGGTLEAVFGAIAPDNSDGIWGITSPNGGATWSAPVNVKGGGPNEAAVYASDVTGTMTGTTPVLTLPQAGNLVIQTGLGAGSPSFPLTNAADGSTLGANLAVDAATGEVVAAWPSGAGALKDYLQGAALSVGAAQAIPGQYRNSVEIAGRDQGPGAFVAYTNDNKHVRLLRYGGGSVAVGSLPGTTAKALGVATGPAGRIWVMWGDDNGGGIAVTRSNKAVTKFEPIQHFSPSLFTLYHVSGDGRLGPLDLLLQAMPNAKTVVPPGEYYARVLPKLSVSVGTKAVKNGAGHVISHILSVKVTDAGDAVSGATVTAAGKSKNTNSNGVATLTVPGPGGFVKVTVSAGGYQPLSLKVKL